MSDMKKRIISMFLVLISLAMLMPIDSILAEGESGNTNEHNSEPIIISSYAHNLVRFADGTAWSWGSNSQGQLGGGVTRASSNEIMQIAYNVRSVSAGREHTLVLKEDGTVWSCVQFI